MCCYICGYNSKYRIRDYNIQYLHYNNNNNNNNNSRPGGAAITSVPDINN